MKIWRQRLALPRDLPPYRQALRERIAGLVLAATALLPLTVGTACAQIYPSKPISLVVPFAAGGPAEMVGRAVAERLAKELGQPVLIVSRGGAGTVIGVDSVAKSAADGYTLLLSGDAASINTASGRKLPYDLLKDLAPLSTVYEGQQMLLVRKEGPFRSLRDLVQAAKASPGQLKFGSSGIGTSLHLSAEFFNRAAGIQALHVPYKGANQVMTDVAGGHIDYVVVGSTAGIPAIKGGSFRALAIMSKTKSMLVPELPTAIEQGVDVETSAWYGLFTRVGTPPEVIAKLHAALVRSLNSNEVKERFHGVGGEARPSSAEELASFLRSDIQKFGLLIRELGIKLED